MAGITDIKAHRDQIRYGLALRSLTGRGVCCFLAMGCLRLRRGPRVTFSILDSETDVIDRRKGVGAGSWHGMYACKNHRGR
eukprot:1111799-Pyramimonas_sp.AAC.1